MIWSAVCFLPHSQAAEGAKPHLYIFDWNRPTPVRRCLNLTPTDLSSLVPSGVGKTHVIDVWSLVILSFHSLFHARSNQSAALMLKALLVLSRSCAARKNQCLDLVAGGCQWKSISVWDGAGVEALRHDGKVLELLLRGEV